MIRPVVWWALTPRDGLVRVERITYPSKGEIEPTVLCQPCSDDGTPIPWARPVRLAARSLVMG